MQMQIFNVTGMSCGSCTSNVTRALKTVAGVGEVTVSLATGKVMVQYDDQLASSGQLKLAIENAGYGVRLKDAAAVPQSKGCCCESKNGGVSDHLAIVAKKDTAPLRMPERSTPAKIV